MSDTGAGSGGETTAWSQQEELARRDERRLIGLNLGISAAFHLVMLVVLGLVIQSPPGRQEGFTEIKLEARSPRKGDEQAPDRAGAGPHSSARAPRATHKEVTQSDLALKARADQIDRALSESARRQEEELSRQRERDAAASRAEEADRVKGIRGADSTVAGGLQGRAGIGKLEPRTFYGMKVHSRKMIFVLDISGSMNVEHAKINLRNAFQTLGAEERFAIVLYDHRIFHWPADKSLVLATRDNKARADAWVAEIPGRGSTNIHDALKVAFEISHKGEAADTVYFMTDGFPTVGVTDPRRILEAVRSWNSRERLILHCIGIGHHDQFLLENLAKENRGVYRALP